MRISKLCTAILPLLIAGTSSSAHADCEAAYREALRNGPNSGLESALQLILSAKYVMSLGDGYMGGKLEENASGVRITLPKDQITNLSFPLLHDIAFYISKKKHINYNEPTPLVDHLHVDARTVAKGVFKRNESSSYCKDGEVLTYNEIKESLVEDPLAISQRRAAIPR